MNFKTCFSAKFSGANGLDKIIGKKTLTKVATIPYFLPVPCVPVHIVPAHDMPETELRLQNTCKVHKTLAQTAA